MYSNKIYAYYKKIGSGDNERKCRKGAGKRSKTERVGVSSRYECLTKDF